ncbi:hypothetical protein ZOSMA_132G00480 [Zostera marina]|uniref:Uncharacterized protein n=1 Tax=Zostera marina TaxID=29655 RepID=A0A0K9Q1E5_ZOSMR|nr:hypothetical protein ZOSMA_132G00480 [Zostera marina]
MSLVDQQFEMSIVFRSFTTSFLQASGSNLSSSFFTTTSDSDCFSFVVGTDARGRRKKRPNSGWIGIRTSMVDSPYEKGSVSGFAKRIEQAWLISQQPRPVKCSSCKSKGHVDCGWCKGTGFFIIGDSMLCEVPSRNTTCVICAGKGYARCSDCKGTGFRAKWLEEPPIESGR